ncbi:DinB family protein [Aeromicrobium ponti]|uniref:Putative damage-inducible protein DinB n=1 Tax=Cytobacillus oceanisediminis TaxID=665099 RepID=A0A562JDQ0_9BACI|nr:DinB family protein [Cytobacillus oceanisediminis]TWH81292.1 putative damage-inducible protein DinB [Cytobacillus oceanisediminis]
MERSQKLLNYFLSHRSVTNELINKIEEKNYDYKPTETSMPAGKLATHMLTSFYTFARTVKDGNAAVFGEKFESVPQNLSEAAAAYTEKTKDLIYSLTNEELERSIDMKQIFGMELTGSQLLQIAMDHEIHHKGNLFVYVREMGHTDLPMFVSRG